MSLWICHYTCADCEETDCCVDGCRYTGEAVLVACEECGELHVAFLEPPVCVRCWTHMEARVVRRR